MTRVLIIGAGGHAQVVADILLCMRADGHAVNPIGYLDDNSALHGQRLLGLPVLGPLASLPEVTHDTVVIAIGSNWMRAELHARLLQGGERFAVACHPSAIIGAEVTVGPGSVLCAGVIINPGSTIGQNVILNTACSVDHHCTVDDHVHIAPGAHLGGQIVVHGGAFVGIGATVMPRVTVGSWSTVGAGACATRDVPDGVTVVGVPARALGGRPKAQ